MHHVTRFFPTAAAVPPFFIFDKKIGIMLLSQFSLASTASINASVIENKSYKTINVSKLTLRCFAFFLSKTRLQLLRFEGLLKNFPSEIRLL